MQALLDLLVPPVCPGCGEEGAVLCPVCAASLDRRLDEPAGVPVGLPASLPPGLVQLEWCATYGGPVRAALHSLKYGGQRRLAEPLGAALARRWARVAVASDVLTWVPAHADRERERGYDQAELLAHEAGVRLGLPVMAALARGRETRAMHALGRRERAENVAAAFEVGAAGPMIVGRWVTIVDDIVTSGATLGGCAAALLDAGAAAVSAICVARDR